MSDPILAIPCEYCGALAGQWCETKTGRRSGYLHSARFYAWRNRPPVAPDWPVFNDQH